MKNKNYITILGWMVNELSLSGNDLICYAVIYGFSQDDNFWEGSQSYLSDWLGVSRRTVIDILKRLISSGLIVKQEYEVNNVKFCKYKAIVPNTIGCEDSAQGGSEDSAHDNNNNNKNKEEKDKSFSKKERIDYDAIVKCWNETNTLLPNVKMLNNKRKEQIRTLLASNNATVDDLMKAINIISMSSFCQGKNDRNWMASFDWLIKDTKSCFSRLFEGAYAFTQDEKNKLSQYLGQTASGGNPTLPNGLTKEEHDMYISKGYEVEMSEQTYTEETDDNIFINGQVYK